MQQTSAFGVSEDCSNACRLIDDWNEFSVFSVFAVFIPYQMRVWSCSCWQRSRQFINTTGGFVTRFVFKLSRRLLCSKFHWEISSVTTLYRGNRVVCSVCTILPCLQYSIKIYQFIEMNKTAWIKVHSRVVIQRTTHAIIISFPAQLFVTDLLWLSIKEVILLVYYEMRWKHIKTVLIYYSVQKWEQ